MCVYRPLWCAFSLPIYMAEVLQMRVEKRGREKKKVRERIVLAVMIVDALLTLHAMFTQGRDFLPSFFFCLSHARDMFGFVAVLTRDPASMIYAVDVVVARW